MDVVVPAFGHDKMITLDGFLGPNHPHVRNTGLAGTAEDSRPAGVGAKRMAAITLANGADNISVFTPLFRALGTAGALLVTGLLLLLVAV